MRECLLLSLFALVGCGACRQPVDDPSSGQRKAFVGASLVDGRGGPPVQDSVLLVRDGRIEKVGVAGSVEVPPEVEILHLDGRTVIPGIINSHGHVGSTEGLRSGPEIYSAETVLRDLETYAHYGVTTVLSLGDDQRPGFEIRNRQNRPDLTWTRLYLAGPVLSPSNPEEASRAVEEVARLQADFVKIRVDDNLGQTTKMSPEVYTAVIEAAHRSGLKVAAHIFYLEDAKALLRADVDFLAHSVRDQDVDEELISLMKEKGVCLCPTLTRELSTFIYESTPDFFQDPFFLQRVDPAVIEQLQSPERQEEFRSSRTAQTYKKALEQAQRNLKRLVDAGVPIAFGTDTGPPGRFQGYFEHLELQLMAESGLSPRQVLASATWQASQCLGRNEVGVLEEGRWADFIVLREDPLADITKSRSLESVWIAGNRVR